MEIAPGYKLKRKTDPYIIIDMKQGNLIVKKSFIED